MRTPVKNQYFGDINDYRKYGLLRTLCGGGQLKVGVYWMLTISDQRTDGRLIRYLGKPELWRSYDPELFDCLQEWVADPQSRNITWLRTPRVVYFLVAQEHHSEYLVDRIKRFAEIWGYDSAHSATNGVRVHLINQGK
jgi:hypothetical protein